ncbi:MAG: metalloprotease PmbA [Oxalobacter sp.]|nr:metalloprotease PmbA [Oxalobacter sp.]
MDDADFIYSNGNLEQIATDVLRFAREKGASDAVVGVSEGSGLSVSVRRGNIDTIERNQDKSIGVTVFLGKQRGNATTSDFSEPSLRQTVEAAYNIARFTAEDEAAGLPEPEMLERHPQDLSLYYRWQIDAEQAVGLAKRCEQAAFDVDSRISNSEGANVQVSHAHFVSASSDGFLGGYPYSSHSLSTVPIASDAGKMQRDYWYTASRNPAELKSPEAVGRYAAERALSRLGGQRITTRKCPVLFEAPMAIGLINTFVRAVSGGALYRKSSFLLDSLNKAVFPEHISLLEEPHLIGAMGSAPFDDEGVRTVRRKVVDNGVVQGYFLSSYSARRLGMKTTGNAGGSHNLILSSSSTEKDDDYAAMLRKMNTGLVVTELLGQGINFVTGDYSRGASGYWVENGVIQYPVQEITIAGNLKDMFAHIAAVGADVLIRGAKQTGSILIEEMTVAGA